MGKRRTYLPEFRRQMVELVRAGRSPAELSREFEPTASAIRYWVRAAEKGSAGKPDQLSMTEKEELERLRLENQQLRVEREILAKAAAWFARETNGVPPKSTGS
jgi:transposase